MAQIREDISANANDLRKITGNKTFRKYFGEIEGEKLKSAPRGYSKDHPEIELLKYKSLLAVRRLRDEEVVSAGFLKHATQVFKALHPLDQFLNQGFR